MKKSHSDSTQLQHAGARFRVGSGLVGALEQSVTFTSPHPTDFPVYARLGNTANHMEVEELLSELHSGDEAIVFASGMAAANAAFFSLLEPGDHVLVQENCYGGIHGFLTSVLARWGVEIEFTPVEKWPERIKANTRMVHFESITNPFCRPQDVMAICERARKAKANLKPASGQRNRPLLAMCDNTFASPLLCKPLTLGADIVLESATKYLNGHSDVICGALVSSAPVMEIVRNQARLIGGFLPTQACSQLLRGMRTLEVRMRTHSENGRRFAAAMRSFELAEKVHYGEEKLAHQFKQGFGGMVTVEFKPSVDTIEMLASCSYIKNVPSLAGTETTATLPWYSTNRMQPDEEKHRLGISTQVVRFSVGLENVEDIVRDVQQAAIRTRRLPQS
jgi:cystathionine beta-lyase/cystathionine gamma-synthase